jgi:antitoxin component of MazEF toxin-antitoxin module
MSRQKIGKENIRKIQKTGRDSQSYMVTLPIDLIDKLDWRKGQKVVIEMKGKSLVITDWKD